ncbi:MAG: hypothetical protein GF355_15650 [Candidatus Eisenbacteria bacterium]|nr:hypothetical protein [Candidatus Eisenbacteria bacterium]
MIDHVIVATQRQPGPVAERLGPRVQIHFAQDADECLALANSLRPRMAILDLSLPELDDPEFLHILHRTLGPRAPLVAWIEDRLDPEAAEQLLAAGLSDIWIWNDPPVLIQTRFRRLLDDGRFRRRIRRARRERTDAQQALILFLRRMEEALSHPLDNLEAHALALYADARRGVEERPAQLDQMTAQCQELRRVVAGVRRLARNLAGTVEAGTPLDQSLNGSSDAGSPEERPVRHESGD